MTRNLIIEEFEQTFLNNKLDQAQFSLNQSSKRRNHQLHANSRRQSTFDDFIHNLLES